MSCTGPQNRYVVESKIGTGAYGRVYLATDTLSGGKRVALKRLPHIKSCVERAVMTLREIEIMALFRGHPHIVQLFHVFPITPQAWTTPSLCTPETDIGLVMDLCEADLQHVIANVDKLNEDQIRFIVKGLLDALACLHAHGIVHRDIKHNNVFVDRNCHVKLGDFGMARFYGQPSRLPVYQGLWPAPSMEESKEGGGTSSPLSPPSMPLSDVNGALSHYVNALMYRAPEVLIRESEYGPGVDQWSLGCLFAELLQCIHVRKGKRVPMFPPRGGGGGGGASTCISQELEDEQLKSIFQKLGTPPSVGWVRSKYARTRIKMLPIYPTPPLILGQVSDEARDLLHSLLCVDPSKRITAVDALNHPFFHKFSTTMPPSKPSVTAMEHAVPFLSLEEELSHVAIESIIDPLRRAYLLKQSQQMLATAIYSLHLPAVRVSEDHAMTGGEGSGEGSFASFPAT